MTAYVIGLDPSLTATGSARITQDGDVQLAHFGRKGRRDESLVSRADRVRGIVMDATDWVHSEPLDASSDEWTDWGWPEVVAIEGMSYGSQGGSAQDRAHLWWELVGHFVGPVAAVPVVEVAPSVRAKWATGRGNADKGAVAAAMARLWPAVEIDCDNCADALALASIAAGRLGWIDTTKARRDAVAKVAWPADLGEAA